MKAESPFVFYTSSQLVEITGRKAAHLKQLIEVLKTIDSSSIFYHIHHAFREFQFAPGAYTNDFAHWVNSELGESRLAEKLANVNIKEYSDLEQLRRRLIEITFEYLEQATEIRRALEGHEFYFCRNIGIVMKTRYEAWTLEEFCGMLKKVGLRTLFFHFFEAPLRLGRRKNDFSEWIRHCFGKEQLATRIEALDPYLYSMDELRDKIIDLIHESQPSFLKGAKKWLSAALKTIRK